MEIFGYTIIKTSRLDAMKRVYRRAEEHLANVIAEYADENDTLQRRVDDLEAENKRLQHTIIQKDKEIQKLKKQIKG